MTDNFNYYAKEIARQAVNVNNSTLGELIGDAANEADGDFPWSDQGDVHENIETRIEDAAHRAAKDELRNAFADDE